MNKWKVIAILSWTVLIACALVAHNSFKRYKEQLALVNAGNVIHIPKQMLSACEEAARQDFLTRASADDLATTTNILYNLNVDNLYRARPGQFQILFMRKGSNIGFTAYTYSINWSNSTVRYDGKDNWVE